MKIEKWLNESGFLDLFPQGHDEHPSNFGDTVYHTCVLLIFLDLTGQLTKFWLNLFSSGVELRLQPDGTFVRSQWNDTPMNRDQMQFLTYCLNLIGRNDLAEKLIKQYANDVFFFEKWVPHWWMNFRRQMQKKTWGIVRWYCDLFEYADMYFDRGDVNYRINKLNPFKKQGMKRLEDGTEVKDDYGRIKNEDGSYTYRISETSIHKNIIRLIIMKKRQPSSITDKLIKYFNKHFDAWEVLKEYHTRYWTHQPPIHVYGKSLIQEVFGVPKKKPESLGTYPDKGFTYNPAMKFPPNQKCFCGSGMKFKKCHKLSMPEIISLEESEKIIVAMKQAGL